MGNVSEKYIAVTLPLRKQKQPRNELKNFKSSMDANFLPNNSSTEHDDLYFEPKESFFANSYPAGKEGKVQPPNKFGNLEELRAYFSKKDTKHQLAIEAQSWNVVKKCTECNKVNAFTLDFCNNCSSKLPKDTVKTDNILFSFVYGVGFKLSIRYQTKRVVVYDDLLCLSRCHFNAIPTDVYVSDVRTLFNKPKKGKNLLDLLMNACKAALEAFLQNDKFIETTFGEQAKAVKSMSVDEVVDKFVICGFNCPPSQYYLHLQFVLLPHVPFHQYMYDNEKHYTKGRFLPFSYVRAALGKRIKLQETWGLDTPTTKIFEFFDAHNVSYNDYFKAEYQKPHDVYKLCNSWTKASFNNVFVRDTNTSADQAREAKQEFEARAKEDCKELSSYGRPYDEGGKVKLYYYKHARRSILNSF